jgi:hypothetical protein
MNAAACGDSRPVKIPIAMPGLPAGTRPVASEMSEILGKQSSYADP